MFLVVQLDFFSLFANFPISSTTLFMSKAVKGLLVAKSEFYLLVVAPRTRLNANREIGIVDVLANHGRSRLSPAARQATRCDSVATAIDRQEGLSPSHMM